MPPTYTTRADFEAYVPGWTTTDTTALDLLLERAERDVDALLGPFPPRPATGLKLDPADLETWQARALSRAVCAQAEYRYRVGDEAFVGGPTAVGLTVSGPDFSISPAASSGAPGSSPSGRVAPQVAVELAPLRPYLRLRPVRARP